MEIFDVFLFSARFFGFYYIPGNQVMLSHLFLSTLPSLRSFFFFCVLSYEDLNWHDKTKRDPLPCAALPCQLCPSCFIHHRDHSGLSYVLAGNFFVPRVTSRVNSLSPHTLVLKNHFSSSMYTVYCSPPQPSHSHLLPIQSTILINKDWVRGVTRPAQPSYSTPLSSQQAAYHQLVFK